MRVFAFIDTNVLLHYRFFRDVNWATELRAEEATLVFAPVVVEELDKRKWAGARRDRVRAKKVLKALKDLGLSVTPVAMRPGVEIVALDEEPADALFARHRLQPRVSDDRLLASVLAFEEAQSGGATIVVLTADTGLSIKAPTRQVAVAAPDERLQRDDEPDEKERELDTARRELAALRAVAPSPKLTLAGEDVLERQVRRFGEFSAGRLGRPQLIVAHDIFTLFAAVKLRRVYGSRVIYDSHELWSEELGIDLGCFGKTLVRRAEAAAMRKADVVVAVTPQIADYYATHYGVPDAIAVPNAEPLRKPRPSVRSTGDAGPVTFLFQGRAGEGRGLRRLVRAWMEIGVDDARLVLRCLPDETLSAIRDAFEDEIRKGRVEFSKPVGPDELVEAASQAQVGIIRRCRYARSIRGALPLTRACA